MNTELEQQRDHIKATLTMGDVLRILGMGDVPATKKIRSLSNPAERTPSLHVYDHDWFDFSTGEGGDQIAFVQKATGASYINALEILARGTSLAIRPRQKVSDMPFEPADFTARFEAEPEEPEYFVAWERLIAEKWPVLDLSDVRYFRAKVVANGDLWIPHYHEGVVHGIKRRHLPRADKTAVKGSTFTVGLYNPMPDRGPIHHQHALIVEGESDAWVMAKMLMSRDVLVLALPSGAGALKDRFIDQLKSFETVGIAFDDDEPGNRAAAWFYERRPQVYRVEVPGGRVAEAAAAGWTL